VIDTHDSATALRYLSILPGSLIVIFCALGIAVSRMGGYKPVKL
jgi:hypothetical protein